MKHSQTLREYDQRKFIYFSLKDISQSDPCLIKVIQHLQSLVYSLRSVRDFGLLLKVVGDPARTLSVQTIKNETGDSSPLRRRNDFNEWPHLEASLTELIKEVKRL